MIAKTDVAKIYETVLSTPGMNDKVKVHLQVTRKNILLLNKLIERGLNGKDTDEKTVNILDITPKESLEELAAVAEDLLTKAGLHEMNEKLKAL